jgi:hypothetical protein
MKASDNAYPSVLLLDGSPPATPASGRLRLFVQGGDLKLVDSAGVVIATGEVSSADLAAVQAELDALEVDVAGKANTSHTQTSATITDLTEAVQDILASTLVGSGVTVTYNDAAGTVTITGLATTDTEAVRDAIGIAMVGVGAITVTVNDAADTITISTTATDRATHTGTQSSSSIIDLTETVQDLVAAMIVDTATVVKTYDDTAGTLTLTSKLITTGSGRIFYLATSDASDIATYKTMLPLPSAAAEQNVVSAVSGTSDVLVGVFATDPGVPGAQDYPPGTGYRAFYASTGAANAVARFHLQVYKRTAAGVETLVRDEFSGSFASVASMLVEWNSTSTTIASLAATDRIVSKLYVQRVSGGTNFNVTTYFEGTTRTSYIQTTIPTGTSGVGVPAGGTTGQALVKASATDYDTAWGTVSGGGGGATPRVPYIFTDARNPLAVGVGAAKVPNITGRTLALIAVRVDVATAPTGSALVVDVNKNGTTIFTTQANRPQVAASAFFASSGTPDVTSWAAGDTLSVDIDQVGSTIAGASMTVTIIAEG